MRVSGSGGEKKSIWSLLTELVSNPKPATQSPGSKVARTELSLASAPIATTTNSSQFTQEVQRALEPLLQSKNSGIKMATLNTLLAIDLPKYLKTAKAKGIFSPGEEDHGNKPWIETLTSIGTPASLAILEEYLSKVLNPKLAYALYEKTSDPKYSNLAKSQAIAQLSLVEGILEPLPESTWFQDRPYQEAIEVLAKIGDRDCVELVKNWLTTKASSKWKEDFLYRLKDSSEKGAEIAIGLGFPIEKMTGARISIENFVFTLEKLIRECESYAAVNRLIEIGKGDHALRILTSLLDDPSKSQSFVIGNLGIKTPEAVEVLQGLLKTRANDTYQCNNIIKSLRDIANERSIEILKDIVQTNGSLKPTALNALVDIGGEHTLYALQTIISDPDFDRIKKDYNNFGDSKSKLYESLKNSGKDEPIAMLKAVLQNGTIEEIGDAIKLAGKIRDPQLIDILKRYLSSEDYNITGQAISAIENIGGDAAIEVLKPILQPREPEDSRSVWSGRALAHIGGAKAAQALGGILFSGELSRTRAEIDIFEYLSSLKDGEVDRVLLQGLSHSSKMISIKSLKYLAIRAEKYDSAVDALDAFFTTERLKEKKYQELVNDIGYYNRPTTTNPKLLPIFMRVISSTSEVNDQIRQAAIENIGLIYNAINSKKSLT